LSDSSFTHSNTHTMEHDEDSSQPHSWDGADPSSLAQARVAVAELASTTDLQLSRLVSGPPPLLETKGQLFLTASMQNLASVTGLEGFPALQSCNLAFNRLRVLPSVSDCSLLHTLRLSHNRLMRLGALPPSLTCLDVSHNRLESLSELAGCAQLAELWVGANPIASLSSTLDSLSLLPKLERFLCPRVRCFQEPGQPQLVEAAVLDRCPSLRVIAFEFPDPRGGHVLPSVDPSLFSPGIRRLGEEAVAQARALLRSSAGRKFLVGLRAEIIASPPREKAPAAAQSSPSAFSLAVLNTSLVKPANRRLVREENDRLRERLRSVRPSVLTHRGGSARARLSQARSSTATVRELARSELVAESDQEEPDPIIARARQLVGLTQQPPSAMPSEGDEAVVDPAIARARQLVKLAQQTAMVSSSVEPAITRAREAMSAALLNMTGAIESAAARSSPPRQTRHQRQRSLRAKSVARVTRAQELRGGIPGLSKTEIASLPDYEAFYSSSRSKRLAVRVNASDCTALANWPSGAPAVSVSIDSAATSAVRAAGGSEARVYRLTVFAEAKRNMVLSLDGFGNGQIVHPSTGLPLLSCDGKGCGKRFDPETGALAAEWKEDGEVHAPSGKAVHKKPKLPTRTATTRSKIDGSTVALDSLMADLKSPPRADAPVLSPELASPEPCFRLGKGLYATYSIPSRTVRVLFCCRGIRHVFVLGANTPLAGGDEAPLPEELLRMEHDDTAAAASPARSPQKVDPSAPETLEQMRSKVAALLAGIAGST
jgi:hypothetical protein